MSIFEAMTRGPYKVHPARLVLGLHGVRVSAVAERAGVTPGAVTRQLAGEHPLSEPVRAAMLEMIGEAGVAEVSAAIPAREALAA